MDDGIARSLPGMELLWKGSIAANLAAVRERIEAAARAARPSAGERHPRRRQQDPSRPRSVREALLAGHRVFGENRVQEAEAKYPALREEFPDLALHLIGPLQTNKVRDARGAVRRHRDRRPAAARRRPWRRRWSTAAAGRLA